MVLKSYWWKFLSFALLVYVCVVGMLTPISSGIAELTPETAKAGEKVSLSVLGYNTHFNDAPSKLKVWLIYQAKGDTINICPDNISVKDNANLTATFQLPAKIKEAGRSVYFAFVINNPTDGTFAKDGAFAVEYPANTQKESFSNGSCSPEVKSNKAKGFIFPYRYILEESIRNLFFHVPMWFAMFLLFGMSVFYAIRYLYKTNEIDDIRSSQFAFAGMLFGICGLLTGMIWAKHTWGQYWVFTDTKLNGAGIITLMYFAYIVLRNSIPETKTRAKISAVYNIFAAVAIIPLLFVLPNNSDSLHPGNGGNPGFKSYDLDLNMRMVFYPAVIGWMMLGYWIAQLRIRIKLLENSILENE
ncbi:MAG: cytochrome c biogenesis protein [Bacteroidetes bacterium]|nr:cytochrome c biogenesis protein [Bacteroidota bacterium]